jgi:glucose/arabinose dehydrogenase
LKKNTMPLLGRRYLVLVLLAGLLSNGAHIERALADTAITFPQTGFTLSDAHGFLSYWKEHGGLAQFGYPISPEAAEVSPTNGRTYITQWFERNRFEYHPENQPPYNVLLGLLGRDLTKGRESEEPFRPISDPGNIGCTYFSQTGHALCRSFKEYWEQHGGLSLYGYPLSEEFEEKSPTNGQVYTVQYFERNRFEYHPENQGTPYVVLLGLLGVQIGGFPIEELPETEVPTVLQVDDKYKLPQTNPKADKWQIAHTLYGPAGMKANLFGASPGPRMMAVAPNGDLFVSDTRTGQVFAMPDRDGDGVADESHLFASGLQKPHGLAFHKARLYVATETAVLTSPSKDGQLEATGAGQKIADLPFGPSHDLVDGVNHDTRSIAFGLDDKMYISVGSDCDLCDDGDPRRAKIMQLNDDGSGGHERSGGYASGIRNAVGLDVDPRTGYPWASINERNKEGNDLPPDLLTPIHGGGDYGWPYCMGIPLQPDPTFGKSADFCASKESAAIALPPHMAPLGIRFYNGGAKLPSAYNYGIFLSMHGSALHDPPYGYDVRFVSLRPGKMAQGAQVFISGWLVNGQYWGRPVDVVFGKDGAMYISDDAGGAVYRVTF